MLFWKHELSSYQTIIYNTPLICKFHTFPKHHMVPFFGFKLFRNLELTCSVVNTFWLWSLKNSLFWESPGQAGPHVPLLIFVSGSWEETRILHREKVVSPLPQLNPCSVMRPASQCTRMGSLEHRRCVRTQWYCLLGYVRMHKKWSSSVQAVTDGSSTPLKCTAKTRSGIWMEAWCLLNGKLSRHAIYSRTYCLVTCKAFAGDEKVPLGHSVIQVTPQCKWFKAAITCLSITFVTEGL